MASVKKVTDAGAIQWIRHCNREIRNDSNTDIDVNRSHLNYKLTPNRDMSDLDYYRKRKSELYCYGRSDVKTMCGWIVTLPDELLTSPEQQRLFFMHTYSFLENRYGKENVINASVHYDEGKMEYIFNRWGEKEKDENGNYKKRLVLGKPHLHFNFIPVTTDKNPKHSQSEKICANDVLNKKDLQHFHSDLQKYLDGKGLDCKVITGKTKAQGRNYTVGEMKEKYELEKELDRLREIEKKYNEEHEVYEGARW